MEFQLYTRISFTTPVGIISESGIGAIESHIRQQSMGDPEWHALNPTTGYTRLPALPDDWQYVDVVQKGSYRGKFATRVRQYYRSFGLKCPDKFIETIGNLAAAHMNTQYGYEFEFVNQFDWDAGDFADEGSCYWEDRAGARDMLSQNEAMAICFYEREYGIARAWLFQHDDLLIVWNGYGLETRTIARVLALYFGLHYRQIKLVNNGQFYGVLYINGGVGYVVGTPEAIADFIAFDFGWTEIYNSIDRCYECGRELSEDEWYTGANSEHYCERCFHADFDYCEACGEVYWNDEMHWTKDDRHVCNHCAE